MAESFSVKRKLLGLSAAVLSLLIPLIIASTETEHDIVHNQSLCPFKLLSGFPCPGCGMTKSLVFMYKGDWMQSLSYHLFGPFVFFFCLGLIPLLILELVQNRNFLNHLFYNKKTGILLALVLGAYHLVRLIIFISTHSLSEILQESIWA
ncbi:MAG: DUF2752 domain-containing protein [Bacteroidia bacterium]